MDYKTALSAVPNPDVIPKCTVIQIGQQGVWGQVQQSTVFQQPELIKPAPSNST